MALLVYLRDTNPELIKSLAIFFRKKCKKLILARAACLILKSRHWSPQQNSFGIMDDGLGAPVEQTD
jgi:hypothetical protein